MATGIPRARCAVIPRFGSRHLAARAIARRLRRLRKRVRTIGGPELQCHHPPIQLYPLDYGVDVVLSCFLSKIENELKPNVDLPLRRSPSLLRRVVDPAPSTDGF